MNRRRWLRPTILLLLASLLAGGFGLPEASAYTPYTTYYKNAYGQLVQIQAAYKPSDVIGRDLAGADGNAAAREASFAATLNQPQDLFVDARDHLYIADTGNNRIVHLDEQGRFVRALDGKGSPLNRPNGVFVDPDGNVYVADTGNQRVVKLDREGVLQREYKRPQSPYLPASFKYEPTKLVVDKRGFLYITTLGAFQGLLQLDPEGSFQNFFGANKVAFSLFDSFKRLFYTREMYRRELSKLPGAIVNTAIDRNGFIYTVTKEIQSDQIKKLNIAGLNQLETRGEFIAAKNASYGETGWWAERSTVPQLQDIAVDADGNMTVVDALLGTISQYDENGNLLFFWGGREIAATSKLGLVKTASAIGTTSRGDLLALDNVNQLIQRFKPTEFGALVHKANKLTQEGRYEESEPLWKEVARINAFYTPALIGLAKAAFKKEYFEEAERLFLQAGVGQGYSDSFWQTRLLWFQNHFALLMNIVAAAALLGFLSERLTRKSPWRGKLGERLRSRRKLLLQLKHAGYLIKHPIDGFHAIRHENKAGFASSLIIGVLAVASFSFVKADTSFVFNPAVYTGVKLGPLLVQFIVLWFGWVVSNFLVSSLMRGEGRLVDVFNGSAYALFPFILVGVPLTLLSHLFTLSEQSIFGFLQLGLIGWTTLLFFWMVQGIQNYSVGEAALNIVFSLLSLAVMGALVFIFISLSGELVGFVYSLYQEVVIR
jgi:hypothetical protein